MKKFVYELVTNRPGIALAAFNLCIFASRPFVQKLFAHQHGEECFFTKMDIFIPTGVGSADSLTVKFIDTNVFAIILSYFPSHFINSFVEDYCFFTKGKINHFFIVLFVTFQWLFIAWLAKFIARKMRTKAF